MSITQKVILVVDDDDALRETICEFLGEDGYVAIGCDSGSSALARLRSNERKADLILLDLMMPGMNGWKFREEQLKDVSIAKIPVVVMTASRDVQGIVVDEILHKPVKLARLVDTVRRRAGARGAASDVARPIDAFSALGVSTADRERRRDEPQGPTASQFEGGGEMGARMRTFDWSASPLGGVDAWPQSLRSAMSICLGSRFPIAIYWGPALTLLYNDGWSSIPGKKHPWALGRPAREVWPEIWDTIAGWFDAVIGTGESIFEEGTLLAMHRHGYTEECYFDFTFTPIRGEGGRVDGVFNAVIETTFRVVNERRTRVLRDLGDELAPARSPEDACVLAAASLGSASHDVPYCALYLLGDEDTRVVRLTACFGLGPESPAAPASVAFETATSVWPFREAFMSKRVQVAEHLRERLGFDLPGGAWPEPSHTALIAPLLVNRKVGGFLVLGVNPRRAVDEEYRMFAERAASHVANAIATASDYATERKRAEALAEIDRAKTAFFSNVSHEFRTPLTLMLGPTEDLLSGALGELNSAQREQLEVLQRNELRLQKLVNTLLDFSRLEAGRVQASYEEVDLSALTRELASAFEAPVTRAGLRFDIDCPVHAEHAYVDRDMWEKIVLNLLSNALKFTFDGGIKVGVRSTENSVVLEVTDSGIGISAHELPRLFERFHRLEGARARTHEGSGIGLALVQELAKLHGGAVSVESTLGSGSVFRVAIPKGAAHLPKTRIHASRESRTATGTAPFVTEAMRWSTEHRASDPSLASSIEEEGKPSPRANNGARRSRILLADDNADMRDYVRRHLEPYWIVDGVEDGQQALASARSHPPDLVLTDVMMPGLDGFALLRELRRDERTRSIPVVMLSARAGEEAKLDGLHAGAEDYLTKPFSARELLARVKTHLEIGRLRRELETEHARLRSIFTQAPMAIAIWRGPKHVFEFVNARYAAMFGARDYVAKELRHAFPEIALAEMDGHIALFDQVYATGKAVVTHEQLVRYDRTGSGTLEDAYVEFSLTATRDAAGAIDGLVAVLAEITDEIIARRRAEQNEENFRRIVAQVDAGIAQTDLTGRFTLANQRYRQIVGRSEEELRQLRVQDITQPEDLPQHLAAFERLVVGGRSFTLEKRFVKPDATIVWVQEHVSRIDDRDGHPQGVAAVSVDITQRKYAQQRLRESEARFRTIFETSEVSIWEEDFTAVRRLVDELKRVHGKGLAAFLDAHPAIVEDAIAKVCVLEVNPATLRMFGATTKEELLGSLVQIFLPESRAVFKDELLAMAEGRRVVVAETALQTLAGLRLDVACSVAFPSEEQAHERVLVTLVDISQGKVAAREREARLSEMERAVRFGEMFVGVLGHDLRNPLSAITTAASLLELRADSEKVAKPVRRIMLSAERMDRMIAQLLDLTRIRLGRGLPIEPARADLAQLSRSIVEELAPVHQREIRLEANGNVTGIWDGDRLSQLLSNLVGNACQHGTTATPILICLDGREPDVVQLEVRNHGVIPVELMPVLFEPLRSGDGRERRDGASGLGLGLYITQQIVLSHGGMIRVESNDGRGTRFMVVLPRESSAATEATLRGDATFAKHGYQ